jgi:hypothetical protein
MHAPSQPPALPYFDYLKLRATDVCDVHAM